MVCGHRQNLKKGYDFMVLNAKDARIFVKFNTDGTRDDTRIEGANLEILMVNGKEIYASTIYADGTYDELDLTNYTEINYEDYMLYCGNAEDGKEYRYNAATQKPEVYVYVPSLEEKQNTKIAEFKQNRDTEEVAPIEYNGNLFDYDTKARDRIDAAIIALGLQSEDATIEWTTADNQDVTVTRSDLQQIVGNVAVRSNNLHVKYRNLKEQVINATADTIDSIVW